MPLTGPTYISLLGQRGGGKKGQVRTCGGERKCLAQRRLLSYRQGHFQLGWNLSKPKREKMDTRKETFQTSVKRRAILQEEPDASPAKGSRTWPK